MLKFMQVIMLNMMFGLSYGLFVNFWEMDHNHESSVFDELGYVVVLVKLLLWWDAYDIGFLLLTCLVWN